MKQRVTKRKRQAVTKETIAFATQFKGFIVRNLNWFLIIALVVLVLQDIFGTHGVLAMRHSQQQATEIQKEINRLDDENRKLQDRVKSLKTDPSTIEHIAREEMGLARPGEYIFKTSPKPAEPANSSPSSTPPANSPARP
jgi:cell division protein FtsB